MASLAALPVVPACRSGRLVARGSALKGCLIALVVLLVLAIAGGVFVYLNWKGWTASLMKVGAEAAINESSLPVEQKTRIITRINSVADDWKNEKISNEQIGKVFETVAGSPILPLGMVAAAEKEYVNPSSLSNEEKAAAIRTLQRVARGVVEKTIGMPAVQQLARMVSEKNEAGQERLKKSLTNEELKAFIAAAQKYADEAKVADEPFVVNFADELDKAIDKALGRAPPAGG